MNGERAMVLYPRNRRGVPAFVVCDSAAWQYDDEHYLCAQARKVAELWGEAPSSFRWYQIARIIHDGLGDLVRLAPMPIVADTQPVIGEATLYANGRAVASGEVTMPTAEDLDAFERASGGLH